MPTDPVILGQLIREFRLRRGLTQSDVAAATNLSENYLSLLENGKRGLGPESCRLLEDVLGVPGIFLEVLAEQPSPKVPETAPLLTSIQNLVRLTLDLADDPSLVDT